jgi:glycine oxidase
VLTHFNGSDDPYGRLFHDGHALYAEVAAALEEETGMDIGWRPLGGIDLLFDEEDEAWAEEELRFNRERGCRVERLGPGEVRTLEPQVAQQARGGLYFPGDHRVDPAKLSQALLEAVHRRGGALCLGERLEDFVQASERQVEVRTSQERRMADVVVLAAGAWTAKLGALLGARVPVRPVRGQQGRFAGGKVRHVLRRKGHHLLPDGDHTVVGATVEEVGFDLGTTPRAGQDFAELVRTTLDRPSDLVEQRAGLRPKPRGGRPLIGPLRDHPAVFVATGHYKNGVLLGPITGQVIAGWIAEGKPPRDMSYFAPER